MSSNFFFPNRKLSNNLSNVCRKSFIIITILICLIKVKTHEYDEEEINETVNKKFITCGSSLRITNIMTKFNLFSTRLTWGTGSGMQMIAATKNHDDYDSLFIIKEGNNMEACETGTPIKCGSIIRLEHVNTGKNLHSHEYPSFVTESQEVCGFGENGYGDNNDNWEIQCYNSKDQYVKGETQFFLLHVPTKKYLYVNIRKSLYNDSNCRNCPIRGHREVSATTSKDKQALFKVRGGIIFNSANDDNKNSN